MRQKEVIPAGNEWVEANIREFPGSPAKRIGDEWMLLSAAGNVFEDKTNWNTLTASWGGLGFLWNIAVAFYFIRPSRHTFSFAGKSSLISLSFFNSSYRKALEYCGTYSGRDKDKMTETGLTPIVFESGAGQGAVGFKEAKEVIICQKFYTHDFDPARFEVPEEIGKNYPDGDYHRMFIGKVLSLRVRK